MGRGRLLPFLLGLGSAALEIMTILEGCSIAEFKKLAFLILS